MKSSKKEFIAEAEELLEESQRLILEIQDTYSSEPDPDTINALFRTVHTLKGVSGLFGLQGIMNLSHALETLMDDIRLGKVEVEGPVVDFLLQNIDVLRGIVGKVASGGQEDDVKEHIDAIAAFRDRKSGKEQEQELGHIDDSILRVLSEYEEHRLKSNIKEGKGIYLVKAFFPLETFDTSLADLTKIIKKSGELISTLPVSTGAPDGSIGFNLMFGTQRSRDEVGRDQQFEVEMLLPPRVSPQGLQQPEVKQQEMHLKSTSTTVRVDIEKLDKILNTIGELTLAKGAVRRIGVELADSRGDSSLVQDINKISQTLERRLAELQDQVLEIRMVPIGQIFGRLAQVVRRFSREIDKQIELEVYGEDTEIDKYLAEEIADPLMHLIRNSMDHGIESPEERRRKGKKEIGMVTLKAYQKGNHVVIELADDGAGVNAAKVRRKAVQKGLVEEGAVMEEGRIIDLIFTPGFSTKDVVSEVSGRGVGLDVVREKLLALGGFCEVDTVADQGTTFTLTLPITLAIIKALIVRVGGERFAVPLTSMSETLVIDNGDIQTVEHREVYYLRGNMLPLVRVDRFFDLVGDVSDRSFAVVVGIGDRRVGLLVDELFGQHEIVIKSIGGYLKKLRGFAGAAEVGKHDVILVLDVESLVEESLTKQKGGIHV